MAQAWIEWYGMVFDASMRWIEGWSIVCEGGCVRWGSGLTSRPCLSRTSHASPSGANTEMGLPSARFSFCRAPARRDARSLSLYPTESSSLRRVQQVGDSHRTVRRIADE